jgi:hypothetical protein
MARDSIAARSRGRAEAFRLRREAVVLARHRAEALRQLGEAVYHGETEETERARALVTDLDARLATTEEHMREAREGMLRRVEQAWREDGPTELEQPPVEPPSPPLVPEPEPVPHEPPGPVIVPEPEPVPHQPPGPVIVPEPRPQDRS